MTQRVVNYTYGTGNPVLPDGSIDVRDGIDNLQSMDVFMNAPEDAYNQRDGNVVRTVAGMNNEFDAQVLNMGFTRVGTFAAGATLTNPRQTLLWDIADGGDGQEYGWSGAFPLTGKVVPAGSTPLTTGGITVGAWMSRFDPALRVQTREALRRSYAEAGYNLVNGCFEAGGVLASATDVLLHESSGKAYYWSGSYPTGVYVVPPNSAPVEAPWVDASPLKPGAGVVREGRFALRDYASLLDFDGFVGNGIADDTVPVQRALNTVKHVVVPAGITPLISSTITVPARTKLEFLGGTGNLPSQLPASYCIKKSTMTTAAIYVEDCGIVEGGGLSCQPGNAGDGIQLAGNASKLSYFYVCKAGRDGIRVGVDGTYKNSNGISIWSCRSTDNGRYGYYVHDGVSVGGADANIGSLIDCRANRNGSDGFRLGHCFWTTVQNCNAEGNIGYGLYLSGINNNNYPECRWPLIIGGDFNEGNNGTVNVNQVYDGSYFATFLQSDPLSVATDAQTGLQGGGIRNVIAPQRNYLQGLTVNTSAVGIDKNPLIVENIKTGGQTFPFIVRQATTGGTGAGPGVRGMIDPNTGTFIDAGSLAFVQQAVGKYGPRLTGYNGATARAVELNTNADAFMPFTDNDMRLGHIASRWSVVYAGTGTINTSDAREKTTPLAIDDVVLDAWGDVQLVTFKWLDAIRQKGEDAARWHFGVIAQQVRDAFSARGLDGCDYGLLCYDEWEDEFEAVTEGIETEVIVDDGKGNERTEMQVIRRETGEMRLVRAAGDRWGIRPDQCLFLEAAYQRRRCDRIEARLAAAGI